MFFRQVTWRSARTYAYNWCVMAAFGRFRYRAIYPTNQHDGSPNEDSYNRCFGYVPAYHKRPWKYSPYRLANEYICTRLGEFIGLPIPPCVMTSSEMMDAPAIFSELNFNAYSDNLPPVFPDLCVKHLPVECAGVLMFDIWIANEDRHDKNLAVDNVAAPKKMIAFDHDMALFGGSGETVGADRLGELQFTRLGITGGTVTGGNRHCLLDEITTAEHFDPWLERIATVPKHFIASLCQEVVRVGVAAQPEADAAVEFLEFRKRNIGLLIEMSRDAFTGITEWKKPGELF